MKKVLLLMFLFVSMGVNAQSELHNAIKNYMKACPAGTESFENSMKPALTLVNEKFIEDYNVQQSEALIKKYCEGPFLEFYRKYDDPLFRRNCHRQRFSGFNKVDAYT